MTSPATAWPYRSTLPSRTNEMPKCIATTTAVMVQIVTIANTAVIQTTPSTLAFAAGYISSGINGSHGPNRKMVNSSHGVIVPPPFVAAGS